ncbi:hypothetical protein Acsp02_89870 [Actinoplanes sp. NBRC 103695]|nr:hypothetical protein Acsp02_89870 [Actinoplanes sp. NBRC 103695]
MPVPVVVAGLVGKCRPSGRDGARDDTRGRYVGTALMRPLREDAPRRTTIIERPDIALPDRADAVTGPGGGGNTTFPGEGEPDPGRSGRG